MDPIELPAATDKLENIPEAYRSLYKQQGDIFIAGLTPASGYGVDNVDAMKRQIAELGDKHHRGTSKLKSYEDADGNLYDPEVIRAALAAAAKSANGAAEEQLEALRGQMTTKHQSETKALQEREAHLVNQIRQHVVTNSAMTALSKHKANADLLLPHVERMTRVDEIDGNFVARILSEDGRTPRISSRQNSTGPMAMDEFVEILRDKFPEAYPAANRQGSGSTGGTGSGQGGGAGGKVRISRDLPFTEKKRLRDEALKAGVGYEYEQ
jgi:hypothetical protein